MQVVGINNRALLEQLGGGGRAEGVREGEADKRVTGGRVDVERRSDGGEVARGEVEGVELEFGMLEKGSRVRGNGRGRERQNTQALRIRWSRRDWYAS